MLSAKLLGTLRAPRGTLSNTMSKKNLYRVVFMSQGQVYEIYARSISQGSLFGFIEVEDVLFGEKSQVVVDPTEERLKTEFKDVKRFSVPMHAVIRIDEVEREGVARISKLEGDKNNLTSFPTPIYTPSGDSGKS